MAAMTENAIAKKTGCKPKCNRREFKVSLKRNSLTLYNFDHNFCSSGFSVDERCAAGEEG